MDAHACNHVTIVVLICACLTIHDVYTADAGSAAARRKRMPSLSVSATAATAATAATTEGRTAVLPCTQISVLAPGAP